MALTYDLTKVRDLADLDTDAERAISEALMFLSMPLEIGPITAANADAVYAAVAMFERLTGPMLASGVPISREDVHRRIGMRTNTGTGSPAVIRKNGIRIARDRLREMEAGRR